MREITEHRLDSVDTRVTTEPDPYVADIYNEWDWVKVGVDEIIAGSPYISYRAEDVYAKIKNKEAVLWVIQNGFIITTTVVDEFSGHKSMLMWLCWVEDRGDKRARKHIAFFDRVAAEAGYESISLCSSIPALQKYLLDDSWDIEMIVYRRGV